MRKATWPRYSPAPEHLSLAKAQAEAYRNALGFEPYLRQHEPFGDYLNYGRFKYFRDGGVVKLDEAGIPKIKYGEHFHYNPVTIAQHALALYGLYLTDAGRREAFLTAVEKLLSLQDASGAFRYPFAYKYYRKTYAPGWASGMAQGQGLSVLARAYKVSPTPRRLQAGNAALEFLLLPVARGGATVTLAHLHPSLRSFLFYEEYPAIPPAYTLNGFLFTLLGVYDWLHAASDGAPEHASLAERAFRQGLLTLKPLLRYYDIGGYSTYDLAHIVYGMSPKRAGVYHGVHLYLLHALCTITNDEELRKVYALWTSYIQ